MYSNVIYTLNLVVILTLIFLFKIFLDVILLNLYFHLKEITHINSFDIKKYLINSVNINVSINIFL